MKINQRIKFWIDTDESSYASECYLVEPQNDWFEVQYYPEQKEGIIIWNKGVLLAQEIYNGLNGVEMRGNVYEISKKAINERIIRIKDKLIWYNISLIDFFQKVKLKI